MIVVDASAALAALTNDGPSRQTISREQLHVPHLIDSEIANGLRRLASTRVVSPDAARKILTVWQHVGVSRYAAVSLLDRVWELRDKVSAYDACYVTLAELLDCPLLTADARLARAPGLRCIVTVVPR